MRILLLGANGQVGTECRSSLARLGQLISATRSGLTGDGVACERADFEAPGSLAELVLRVRPDVVVNAAAHTAVDAAETEAEVAWRVNAHAPAEIAGACASLGASLVHYSTDYVFDGQAEHPYREDAPTSPLGVYGASKLAGEVAIVASGAEHLILRTAWVYALHGRNFLRTMLRLGAERDVLRVVADQVGSPTPAPLIAETTARLLALAQPTRGIRHLTASGQTSWHGFAVAIFEEAVQRGLLPRAPRVEPIPTSEYPTPAQRPAYSVLDGARLAADLGAPLQDWRTGLAETLAGAAP